MNKNNSPRLYTLAAGLQLNKLSEKSNIQKSVNSCSSFFVDTSYLTLHVTPAAEKLLLSISNTASHSMQILLTKHYTCIYQNPK